MEEPQVEGVARETRTVPIERLDPKDIGEFLPGWELAAGSVAELKHGFTTNVNNTGWALAFDPVLRRVNFSESSPTLLSPRIHIRNVDKVEFDNQSKQFAFLHKGGTYRICDEGLTHIVTSLDGEASISFNLDRISR